MSRSWWSFLSLVALYFFFVVVVSLAEAKADPPHYYYCEPTNSYFPYVQTCSAPWKEIDPRPTASAPAPVQQVAAVSPAPAPAPAAPERAHTAVAYPIGMPAPTAPQAPAAVPVAVTTPAAPPPAAPEMQGPVSFVFGADTPTIVCAVSQLCDIALQPGEKVNQVVLGDSESWRIDQATEGGGATETVHLIITPANPDLETSMIVLTKMRTYHLRLQSHRKNYMLQVGFTYPGAPAPAKIEEAVDESDGLVKIGDVTYVKGREPRTLVSHGKSEPPPVEAAPRPEVKQEGVP